MSKKIKFQSLVPIGLRRPVNVDIRTPFPSTSRGILQNKPVLDIKVK